MIKTTITDGSGSGQELKISPEGQAEVVVHPHPPKGELDTLLPFRQYFTDDGSSSGSFDMQVAASAAAPQEFWIKADVEKDIYIKSISFVIADASATLDKFGNITALTNGVEFLWETSDLGSVVIADSLKSNFDFIRLCGGTPAFGNTSNSFRASNVEGTSEGYIPFMDTSVVFGVQYGLRLRAGSEDTLKFIVKDNTTGVDAFNVIGYGSKF